MKIEDPRSVTSSPSLRPATPATPDAARTSPGRAPNGANATGQPAARVELSARSRELNAALDAANAAPDVRTDKVNDAKQRIAQGTYTVNAETVARRILDTSA
jgi:negative regulator of flagellin synthesis FlgM